MRLRTTNPALTATSFAALHGTRVAPAAGMTVTGVIGRTAVRAVAARLVAWTVFAVPHASTAAASPAAVQAPTFEQWREKSAAGGGVATLRSEGVLAIRPADGAAHRAFRFELLFDREHGLLLASHLRAKHDDPWAGAELLDGPRARVVDRVERWGVRLRLHGSQVDAEVSADGGGIRQLRVESADSVALLDAWPRNNAPVAADELALRRERPIGDAGRAFDELNEREAEQLERDEERREKQRRKSEQRAFGFAWFSAGLAWVGLGLILLAVQLGRRRRPLPVSMVGVVPAVGCLALAELNLQFGGWFAPGGTDGSTRGQWVQWALLLGVLLIVFSQLHSASQRLYVLAMPKEAGLTLAQAALAALDPAQFKEAIVEVEGDEVRLGKDGPGLEVNRRWWLGLLKFQPIGGLSDATRAELLAGVRRCLDHESVAIPLTTVVRLLLTGLVVLGAAVVVLP